jgi:hypothetical protein
MSTRSISSALPAGSDHGVGVALSELLGDLAESVVSGGGIETVETLRDPRCPTPARRRPPPAIVIAEGRPVARLIYDRLVSRHSCWGLCRRPECVALQGSW